MSAREHRPLDDLAEAFAEMRAVAVPGDCSICLAVKVPTIELTNCDNPKLKKRVCIDCMTGKTKRIMPGQQN